jgi:hypothetical protein
LSVGETLLAEGGLSVGRDTGESLLISKSKTRVAHETRSRKESPRLDLRAGRIKYRDTDEIDRVHWILLT